MADIKPYFKKLIPYAGGYVNDPTDKGGATKYDVTLNTWRSMGYDKDGDGDIDANDIRILTTDDAMMVCKVGYWDRWRADSIKNQSVAESLVEWVWGSGKWGVVIPQKILAVLADGRVGTQTINAVNNCDQAILHEKIRLAKLHFIDGIVQSSINEVTEKTGRALTEKELLTVTQKRFEIGWKRRVNEFIFKP